MAAWEHTIAPLVVHAIYWTSLGFQPCSNICQHDERPVLSDPWRVVAMLGRHGKLQYSCNIFLPTQVQSFDGFASWRGSLVGSGISSVIAYPDTLHAWLIQQAGLPGADATDVRSPVPALVGQRPEGEILLLLHGRCSISKPDKKSAFKICARLLSPNSYE